jgi:hypothetical protein
MKRPALALRAAIGSAVVLAVLLARPDEERAPVPIDVVLDPE